MDELKRVERLYGSVPEYNRVMEEESGRAAHERVLDEMAGHLKNVRPDLSEEQAAEVLESVMQEHDSDTGAYTDALEFWADSMFPKKETTLYTVEITETLIHEVTVEAETKNSALMLAVHRYKTGENLCGRSHTQRPPRRP